MLLFGSEQRIVFQKDQGRGKIDCSDEEVSLYMRIFNKSYKGAKARETFGNMWQLT